jgi:tRNA A-37 threonylcarbamoyl transferase component Bud32
MKPDRATRSWMLIFTGIFFIASWLISFSPWVASIESGFHQQLLALAPGQGTAQQPTGVMREYVSQYVLLVVFALILLQLLVISGHSRAYAFIILVVFSLFMSQLSLAVFSQAWLPVVWAGISFVACSLILQLWASWPDMRRIVFPEPDCSIALIRRLMAKKAYNEAVLLIRECPFSDALYDVAYDLGVELEQVDNLPLAREVYAWMVQYDPAMCEFVDRIDRLISSDMQRDSTSELNGPLPKQFGHFQLLGRKARGATATVYEAHDLNTHQRIALKILNQRLEEDGGERDIMGFLHEAITVSSLEHPNIVKIHDADVLGDRAYIAMDYISGYPMSERIRRRKLLTAAESLRIMRSVLSALVLAQQKGIIHGDIKPANIMYDKKRDIYIITDFGAASRQQRKPGVRDVAHERRIVGTPAYMSPEQLSGGRVDGRSDLFSLAVTIFHLLSGKQPFQGGKLSELKDNILHHEVDIDQLSVPDSIKQILQKALHKKPYQRFADASQMLHSVLYCQQKLLDKKKVN